ncbi:MAG: hypothetical protein HYW48_03350 [Deltaproteobacteria bacterium]|nr:hypothetical protein [Deltaproteobacteria bacterium]
MTTYKNIDHVSNILWHFIGPKNNESIKRSLQRLETFFEGTVDRSVLVLKPHTDEPHRRQFSLPCGDSLSASEMGEPNANFPLVDIVEPRALCFCDIPFNQLGGHMNRYGSIGIGLRKNEVINRFVEFGIRPVLYYPVNDPHEFLTTQQALWTRRDDATELGNYVKVPTLFPKTKENRNTESFDQIYEEREWRGFKEIRLNFWDIAFLLLPNRDIPIESENLNNLMQSHVGLIVASDIFGQEGQQ